MRGSGGRLGYWGRENGVGMAKGGVGEGRFGKSGGVFIWLGRVPIDPTGALDPISSFLGCGSWTRRVSGDEAATTLGAKESVII